VQQIDKCCTPALQHHFFEFLKLTILHSSPFLRSAISHLGQPLLEAESLPTLVIALAPPMFENFILPTVVKPGPVWASVPSSVLFTNRLALGLFYLFSLMVVVASSATVLQPSPHAAKFIFVLNAFAMGVSYAYGGFMEAGITFLSSLSYVSVLHNVLLTLFGCFITGGVRSSARWFAELNLVERFWGAPIASVSHRIEANLSDYLSNSVRYLLQNPQHIVDFISRIVNLFALFLISCLMTMWAVVAGPAIARRMLAFEANTSTPSIVELREPSTATGAAAVCVLLLTCIMVLLLLVAALLRIAMNASVLANIDVQQIDIFFPSLAEPVAGADPVPAPTAQRDTGFSLMEFLSSPSKGIEQLMTGSNLTHVLRDLFTFMLNMQGGATTNQELAASVINLLASKYDSVGIDVQLTFGLKNKSAAGGLLDPLGLLLSEVHPVQSSPGAFGAVKDFLVGKQAANSSIAGLRTFAIVVPAEAKDVQVMARAEVPVSGLFFPILAFLNVATNHQGPNLAPAALLELIRVSLLDESFPTRVANEYRKFVSGYKVGVVVHFSVLWACCLTTAISIAAATGLASRAQGIRIRSCNQVESALYFRARCLQTSVLACITEEFLPSGGSTGFRPCRVEEIRRVVR
jgi:hypothetical protein